MAKAHLKDVVKLGSPLLAGIFAEYIMYIADSVMIGRLGTDYLAAVAVGGIVAEMLWAFAWTTAPGTQALASRRFGVQGENSFEFTGQVIDNGILFGVLVGFLAVIVSFWARDFLSLLIKTPRTV